MERKRTRAAFRRVLIVLAFYLSVILAALILGVTYQIAGWVAQVAIALSLFRLIYMFGWGMARNGRGWRT